MEDEWYIGKPVRRKFKVAGKMVWYEGTVIGIKPALRANQKPWFTVKFEDGMLGEYYKDEIQRYYENALEHESPGEVKAARILAGMRTKNTLRL